MSVEADKYSVKANSGVVAGTITRVDPMQTVGAKNHRKISIVVTTDGRYPQVIPVEFFGSDVDAFETSGAGVNDEVLVAIRIKGRASGSRIFGSNGGYAIKVTRKGDPPPPPSADDAGLNLDDLPF